MAFDLDMLLNSRIYEDMRTPLFLRAIKNPPSWAFDIIQPWNSQYFSQASAFLRRHYWTSQGSINVFQVVGTAHQQYQNRPWMDLFTSGKRMEINLPLQNKKPEYYRETTQKLPSMYFNTFDGINYYIGADGNHRTCIAKFMFYETGETQLHGVTINHYDIDETFHRVYLELNKKIQQLTLPVTLIADSRPIKREDTAGWMIDYFQPYLLWKEYDELTYKESSEELDFEHAEKKLFDLTTQLMMRRHNNTKPKSFVQRLLSCFIKNERGKQNK